MGQVPFTSITFGLCTTPEGRLISDAMLTASIAGLGHGETAIFPQLIFQCKKGVNQDVSDPNYDLFLKAIECSSKRLFPNFVNVDASFNLQYYDPSNPDTAVATMGCVDGEEVVTYKFKDQLYVESFRRMFERLEPHSFKNVYGASEYLENKETLIYDSSIKDFTPVKKIIKNPDQGNWNLVKLDNGRNLLATSDHPLPVLNKGRTFVQDLKVGDQIPINFNQFVSETETHSNEKSWLDGLLLCDSSYSSGTIRISLGMDEKDIAKKAQMLLKTIYNYDSKIIEQKREAKGYYLDVVTVGGNKKGISKFNDLFGGWNKVERKIPDYVFKSNRESRLSFLAGLIDADGHIENVRGAARIEIGSTNKELAIQQAMLAQSLGIESKIYINKYNSKDLNKIRHKVEFYNTFELNAFIQCHKKNTILNALQKEGKMITPHYGKVKEIIQLGNMSKCSYDVETDSDHFDVSGINSHNCRTRSIVNRHSEEVYQSGKGNVSFNSINLPKLGIEYGILQKQNIEAFWSKLDELLELTLQALLHRYNIQTKQSAKASDFMMQNGVWKDGEKLKPNERVGELLKHGSLSIGFVGLAECLKALFGAHHGEDSEVWDFGYHVIKHIRDFCDENSEKLNMNITCFASPAESLCGTFAKINKAQYGSIKDVSDRDYITNSFHIPVYYSIKAHQKIEIEAPFHELCNGGHISYVELDGNARNNQEAFKKIVQYAFSQNVGYFSINHPVDKCQSCNYDGVIESECPVCGEDDPEKIYKIRRVTGYLTGNVNRFNPAKQAEEKDRVKHFTFKDFGSC